MDPKIEARKAREQSAATLEGIIACQGQVADLAELVGKLAERFDRLERSVGQAIGGKETGKRA